jgi:diguanylate cyclase (GGDEF)-like protein
MQSYLYIELNVFALIILLVIFINIRHKADSFMTEQKLFLIIVSINAGLLLSDTLMWVLDGNKSLSKIFIILSTLIYYLLHPVICMIWDIYVDFQINRRNYRIKKLLALMILPVVFSSVLSVMSIFGNFYYYIDSNNVYHRGNLFYILPLICFAYVAHAATYVLQKRKRIHKSFFISFLLFAIPPIVGSVIQFRYYGIPAIWTGMTISILVVFINIQNEQMYKDYLTGLYNRRQLDLYLQDTLLKSKKNTAGIMLDINHFKSINDLYGHSTGDRALRVTAQILIKSFYHHCFISRFGGDEFVILMDLKDSSELDKALFEIKENFRKLNEGSELPCGIHLSIGADIYSPDSRMTCQEFLNHIDALMYQDKQLTLQDTAN